MTLTEALERLNNARDLNGIMPNDAVDVILGATCPSCKRCVEVYPSGTHDNPRMLAECSWGNIHTVDHGCRAWEKREEQA